MVEAPSGDATTTLYLEASQHSQHPLGVLTSIVDTFINGGTTTEYMTQHLGTHIQDVYAKIQTTSSREYYRISPTATYDQADQAVRPTGLIGSSTSLAVNGPASTFYTVEEYRTYVDGHYAHLVSSISNVVTDPAHISPTPIYNPAGAPTNSDIRAAELAIKKSLYSSYDYDIQPSKAVNYGLATRTVGQRIFPPYGAAAAAELENEIEADLYAEYADKFSGSRKLPRQIDLDAVESDTLEVRVAAAPVQSTVARPTYTVGENGKLTFPTPSIEPVRPIVNKESSTQAHRFAPPVKPSKTKLDSVTYVGFVDFTTTIDDTVVIFKPKAGTFNTATRSLIRPVIEPTRSFNNVIGSTATGSRQESPRSHPFAPDLSPSRAEADTAVGRESAAGEEDVRRHTSGIDALKSLLAVSSSRRTFGGAGGRVTSDRFTPSRSAVRPSRPSTGIVSSTIDSPTTDPPVDIIASIDPTSDVEIVFKTLYTTYTYFTTFFRETTTRVKSREEVISVVLTVTNLLKSTDLPSISSSCALDSSCVFKSTDSLTEITEFTDGHIGRPNNKVAEVAESPRAGPGRPVETVEPSPSSGAGVGDAVLRTFYTTYTYFSTLFVDGTSTVSTRTEVYSNVQSASVALSQIASDSVSILASSPAQPEPSVSLELEPSVAGSAFPVRRLEISSVAAVKLQSELTTPGGEDEEERPSTDRVPRVTRPERVTGEPETDTESAVTDWIQPTQSTLAEEEAGLQVVTQETPALTEQVTELVTAATTESEAEIDETATEFVPRTLYTTFTYFTTLFQQGSTVVTSNLETVTNVMTDPFIEPSAVEPSVTIFTTFTYWTTLFDVVNGQNITSVTSREETLTDILPASVTSQFNEQQPVEATEFPQLEVSSPAGEPILSTAAPSSKEAAKVFTFYTTHYEGDSTIVETILSTSGPVSTAIPEIQSGEAGLEVISASTLTETPSASTILPTSSFQDLDDDLTLGSQVEEEEGEGVKPTRLRGRVSFSRPGNTFTPVIRPVLRDRKPGRIFRPSNLRVTTTVATRTRNSVKPTLIATPASSAPQPTPSFGSSSRSGFLASSSLFQRGQSRFSSASGSAFPGSASISPSVVSRAPVTTSLTSSLATTETPAVVISPIRLRRPNPFRARLKERQQERLANLRNNRNRNNFNRIKTSDKNSKGGEDETRAISIPNLPVIPGGNAPIFVSSQRQTISPNRRVPKVEIALDSIEVDASTAIKRERARERIKSLFSRKRPLFGRFSASQVEDAQSRRKRQVTHWALTERQRYKTTVNSS